MMPQLYFSFTHAGFVVVGVPPLVSRRVLETMTYLARNHPFVAKILLQLKLSHQVQPECSDQSRGKAVMVMEEESQNQDECLPIELLLRLLNQPLYLRSVAHLEQVVHFVFKKKTLILLMLSHCNLKDLTMFILILHSC